MAKRKVILGPTFEEMLDPQKMDASTRQRAQEAMVEDPLDPVNFFNITWKGPENQIRYVVLPEKLTGVKAKIVVLYGKDFPTMSHKVGATYSILMELVVRNLVDPYEHTLVWPSTGNYGIGGAWVGCRMGFDTVVILPELMSKERFDLIESYGARVIATPGCESNVKEIYDKAKELKAENPEKVRVLNQFEEFGNYRFHYYVTGNTILELLHQLEKEGTIHGGASAVVSSMGSAGTIACGDRLKEVYPHCLIVGSEPIQCPTLIANGYGGHDIQGIGDKHVTWIHNVMNMDAMVAVDDVESKKGLQLLTDPVGKDFLVSQVGIPRQEVEFLSQVFGISGVCNVLSAIKAAKYYDMGEEDTLITIATDNIQRYGSVMEQLDASFGPMDTMEAAVRFQSIFMGVKTDWLQEGTYEVRKRWHNLKYYTWVEQQGKSVEELNLTRTRGFWDNQKKMVQQSDELLRNFRRTGDIPTY
ncbi:MAG TPA: pyridoxal-phosphate dependent enzyme [Thermotogota bacterium]|nr:pyridoxal-phosphate dependent enzyme [Thermotogota bacterium]HRW91878.1 pyridoxal-phosphate dependent enzyme [Thermotogota bacterium]